MEFIVLTTLVFLYVLISLFKETIADIFEFKICSICASFIITWSVFFFFDFLGFVEVNAILIAILMGGSVIGFMYFLERVFKKYEKAFGVFRILQVSLFILAVYYILVERYLSFGITFAGIIVLLFSVYLYLNSKQKTIKSPKDKKAIDNLKQKLENCCE